MKKLLLITLLFLYNTSGVYASRSQIISLPDGTTIVCFYHNGGKFVDCQPL